MAKTLQFFQCLSGFRYPDLGSDPDSSSADFGSDSDSRVFPTFTIPFLIPVRMAYDSYFDSSVFQI